MNRGDTVKVTGRRGRYVLDKPLPGGWRVRDSDERCHAYPTKRIKETHR